MKWFMNMKIAGKLLSSFIVVAIIAAVVGAVGIISLKTADNSDTELYEHMTVPISQVADINKDFQMIRVGLRDIIIEQNSGKIKVIEDSINVRMADMKKNAAEVDKTSISSEMKDAFKDFNSKNNNFEVQLGNVLVLAKANKNVEAVALLSATGDLGKASNTLQESIDKLIAMKVADAKTKAEDNTTAASRAINIMLIVIVIGVIMAIALGLFLSKIISTPMKLLAQAADKLALGDVDVNIESKTKDEIGKLTGSFAKMIDNIKGQSEVAQRIAAGELSIEIIPKSDKDVLSKNLKLVVETLQKLALETEMLTKTTVEGKLDTRGNGDAFKGGYKEIVVGVNKLIDAFVGPINVTAEYVDRISKGDIPPRITDTYNGDFNEIKNNLNSCIDSINLLVSDASNLVEAAVAGKLSTRADASKHSGDYKKIVQGVNNTLDAVIEPVKEASAVLAQMANGNLKVKVKGDYKGDHADIKNALNDTIDSLSSYVTEISEVLDEMSNSNLKLSINNEYKGDFAQIKDALNLIIQSFNEVFTEINNAADQVSAGSNQVSDGSQALSQGTTEQASSIEELTASITEVAAQTKQNAVNASQANELALNAKEGAALGNSHMKEMLKSMEEINESSSSISKIIKVIDDIAFQTNMLALNAAVEAARAGQHGKGFAVVAEEVRNLAARSAKAAKETTDLVEGSMKKVEIGTKIANNTAESLDQIVVGVSKAATLVGEIAAASNEQATAIYQINKGIEQVSDVVQTNSATAEQSAAASEELSSQASMLKNMVGKFRLKRGSTESYNESSIGAQRNSNQINNKYSAHAEAAATNSKPRISLSNTDFGKY
ncbi:methyl-accepting chemotaxis protein [Clostridium sp.]|uniref:methyl-accepting chemotaxis protein n=1 Tax=Clostridium sp. TaxID=1506 RepID=UPI003D6D678E